MSGEQDEEPFDVRRYAVDRYAVELERPMPGQRRIVVEFVRSLGAPEHGVPQSRRPLWSEQARRQ